MASPQLDNGFTRIANEILEALSTVQMSGTEWQFVMCLFRKTYGFNKKEDWVTGSQIVEMTGLKKERVSEAKKRLLARNIVTEKRNKIAFHKDYDQWVELRKSVTVVTEKRNKVLRKSVNTIDNKETITKDISHDSLQGVNKIIMKNDKTIEKKRTVKLATKTRIVSFNAGDMELAQLLADLIKKDCKAWNQPESLDKWAEDINKIQRLDGRTRAEVAFVIRWAQASTFWSGNVLSGAKLRKQFNTLAVQIAKDQERNGVAAGSVAF